MSAHAAPSVSAATYSSAVPSGTQQSTTHVADRTKSVANNSQVTWKSDSEDMIRARKSAQRVILSKFKNFWPSDDDVKLTARAFDFERGEYEVRV